MSFASSVAHADAAGAGNSSGGINSGARGARWQQGSVSVEVDPTVDQLGADAFEAVVQAAGAWQNAPGMLPTLIVQRGQDDSVGYHRSGKNKNTVHYAQDGDPMANGALAITVITFDAHAKQILDADVVLNGEHGFAFYDHDARSEGMTTYDLQNVLTHELGHLLGLGEDFIDEDATMYAFSQPGEIGKRDLEVVDKDSIAQLYNEPFNPETQVGCGGASIAGNTGEAWLWAALGLGGLGFVMRRRSSKGTVLAATALGALVIGFAGTTAAPESTQAALSAGAEMVPVTVTGSESSWDGGLIVTKLSLRRADQPAASEALTVRTLGGRVGDLVQVVGHVLPPRVGDSLRVKIGTGVKGEAVWVAPMGSTID